MVQPALSERSPAVSARSDDVTSEPCIAEKSEPPKTAATPSMWNGCMRMLCSAWKTSIKLNVPLIPKGIPFHILGVAAVFGGSLFSAMHGSLVTSSLLAETAGDLSLGDG